MVIVSCDPTEAVPRESLMIGLQEATDDVRLIFVRHLFKRLKGLLYQLKGYPIEDQFSN